MFLAHLIVFVLFRRKPLNNNRMTLAGLLAYVLTGLPSHPRFRGQWCEEGPVIFRNRQRRRQKDIYSYGDSAGFTPVFPFNGATRQPGSAAKVRLF
jgi:hypothetical protein